MTNEELDAIEARLAKITPGKWTATEFGVHTDTPTGVWNTTQICPVTPAMGKNEECYQRINAEFIANAPGDERALIAEVRRLKAEADRTALEGVGVQVLVAEIERLKSEAAKNRRVFVWEPFRDDGETHYRLRLNEEFEFRLTYYNEEPLLELYSADDEPLRCWDAYWFPEERFSKAEQMIRELGFARDGDVFDRSKVTP